MAINKHGSDDYTGEGEFSDDDVEAMERIQLAKEKQVDREHIKKWFERIRDTVEHDRFYRDRWVEDRKTARGEYDTPVSVNLIAAMMAVLSAFLYAKNPDVSTTPSDSVDRARLTLYRQFSETIQIIVSRLFKDAGLKKIAKRWIRGSQTVGIGWVKAAMQVHSEKQPLIENGINDLTDQIAKIRSKQIQIALTDQDSDLLASELESNIKAYQEKLEIQIAEGLALDYMDPADVIVATECGEVENYLQAPWVALVNYKSRDEALAITGWDTEEQVRYLDTASKYYKRPRKSSEHGQVQATSCYVKAGAEEVESSDGFYMFYEVWALTDGVVYTLLDGCNDSWARPVYVPTTGRRFYPVFALAWHWMDGERYPTSDTRMLQKLAEEYNETRSDFRVHRQRARPGTIFNKAAVDPESVKNIAGAVTEEYTGVTLTRPDADVNQIFAAKKYALVDPGLYDTTAIQRDMEKVSGAQEALTQSSLSVEKTATEASIQEAGRGARTGARQDDLEDVLTELSEYVVQLTLQIFDMADAERYAGPGAVWLNLTTDQALMLFDVTVKAGSTGKPRRKTDRDSWATIMPLITDLIMKIGDARSQNKEYAAKPLIALLKETLERADDTADIEMFLPVIPPEEMQAANQPDPESVARTKLDTAGSIEKTASAVEKLPSLVLSPQVRELLGIAAEEPSVDDISGALGQPQQAPAPNPVTEV